jgi:hypothetical protein
MELGVFIPIGNNGWLISTTSPQYKPSFDLNREIVQKAERFDFALSMIKLHGFGGPSQFWDYNLESFTLIAGLAPVTSRIRNRTFTRSTARVFCASPRSTIRDSRRSSRHWGRSAVRPHRHSPSISAGTVPGVLCGSELQSSDGMQRLRQ